MAHLEPLSITFDHHLTHKQRESPRRVTNIYLLSLRLLRQLKLATCLKLTTEIKALVRLHHKVPSKILWQTL